MSTLLHHASHRHEIADRSRATAHFARPVSQFAVSSEITGGGSDGKATQMMQLRSAAGYHATKQGFGCISRRDLRHF
jgi:hypothetical protein